MSPNREYDPIDLSSLSFWEQPARARDLAFAKLRADRPVSFHRGIDFGFAGLMQQEDPGFWAVASHQLVREVSRDAATFCSGNGVLMEDFPPELGEQIASFLVMDGARHHALRRLISSAFTPRNVARIEEQIAAQARRVVDQLLEAGSCDLVTEVATKLPLWTISEMVGIPLDARDQVATAANLIVSLNDPSFVSAGDDPFDGLMGAVVELWQVSLELAQRRREEPADDLMTALVQAKVDDRMLVDEEIGAFMVLLAIAGNETTRNTISHTVAALQDFPEARAALTDDLSLMPTAIDEFVRWATPVIQFRRTATRDTVLGGIDIAAGDKVVVLYESANRDESVFDDPWRFDIRRTPNDHLGFGGGGSHYCLGASLARTQLTCLFTELLQRAPRLEVHDTIYGRSNFSHSINSMPCSV